MVFFGGPWLSTAEAARMINKKKVKVPGDILVMVAGRSPGAEWEALEPAT